MQCNPDNITAKDAYERSVSYLDFIPSWTKRALKNDIMEAATNGKYDLTIQVGILCDFQETWYQCASVQKIEAYLRRNGFKTCFYSKELSDDVLGSYTVWYCYINWENGGKLNDNSC